MKTTNRSIAKKGLMGFLKSAKIYFWLTMLLSFFELKSQFITNGGFETNTAIPTVRGQITNATNWFSPTNGTPDYYHRKANPTCTGGINQMVGIPTCLWKGYQKNRGTTGDSAFAGIWLSQTGNTGYREYLMYQLNTPLVGGHTYQVCYYVNSANQNTNATSHLGVFFSANKLNNGNVWFLSVTPQLTSPANVFFNDTQNWVLVTGIVTLPGTGNFNWMTLGCFDVNINLQNGTNYPGNGLYYYYDDISISECGVKNPAFTHGTPKCGVPIQFTSTDTTGTHLWDFGDGETSASLSPTHQYASGGVYIVKHHVFSSSTCGCDTVAIDTIKMTDCCFCKNCGTDLVRNGHFSDTCHAQYSSELWVVGCPNKWTDPNQYTEATDASLCNYNWCGLDHTKSAGSKFLVADGPSEYRPSGSATEAKAWYQKVGKITEGHHYCFTAYVKNICKACSDKPSLRLQIIANGTKYVVDAIEDLAYNECCDAGWTKMCGSWTGPAGVDSVELDVLITRGQWTGNDAGIDDISFSESDVKPSADFTADTSICTYTNDTFTSVTKNGQHSWTFGDGSSSSAVDPVHHYKAPGTYTVRHIVSSECGKDTVTKTVHVYDCCCQTCESNLVYNGNFSNPSCFTGYYTDLMLNPCRAIYSHSDSITEDSNAQAIIPSWYGKDHTGVAGSRFLIVDYPWRPGNQRAWYSYVHITPNRLYCFAMYVKNLLVTSASYMNPTFELHVKGMNGPLIRRIESLEFDSGWMKVCGDWVSGPTDTLIELDVVVIPGTPLGFDLGIDDISFAKECLYEPSGGGNGGGTASLNQEDIKNAESDPGLSIVPIPVKRGTPLHLAYTSKDLGNANISLFDETGKLLWHINQNFVAGENGLDIPTSDFAAGIYYVQVSQGAAKSTRKIIISEL